MLHRLMFGEGVCTLETVLAELSEVQGKRLLELKDVITDCLSKWEASDKTSQVALEVDWDELNLMEEVILRRHSTFISNTSQITGSTAKDAQKNNAAPLGEAGAIGGATDIMCNLQEATSPS